MQIQSKVERFGIAIIAILCIMISILDFVGALDAFPWISQRIPVMILLVTGMIALYIVTQHNRKFNRIDEHLERNKNEILSKVIPDDTDQAILKVIHNYWTERENEIERQFKEAESKSKDINTLVDFLEASENAFNTGNAFGSKQKNPYNVNIMAIRLDGYITYHHNEQMRSIKLPPDHPVWEILPKRNGTLFWLNYLRGKLKFQIKSIPIGTNPRFTKLYFREIVRLGVIIVFESHITVFPYLLNVPFYEEQAN